MTNLDIAGILSTYALKIRKTTKKEKIKELIKELKQELDLRRIEGD